MPRGDRYSLTLKDQDTKYLDPAILVLLETPDNPTPEDLLLAKEQTALIDRALTTLSPREERALRLYYGLGESEPHTLDQIAEPWDLSRERPRQIMAKAMRKLKHKSRLGKLDHPFRHNHDWRWAQFEAEDEDYFREQAKAYEERERAKRASERAKLRKWTAPLLIEITPFRHKVMFPDVVFRVPRDLADYQALLHRFVNGEGWH